MNVIKTASYHDQLELIDCESVISPGLPNFKIIGLAGASIKESEERIKAALVSCNHKVASKKIILSLSPGDLPKEGSHFDLPLALLLYFTQDSGVSFDDFFVFGELGLFGQLKAPRALFSLLLFLSSKKPGAKVLIPSELKEQASLITQLEVYAVDNLQEAVDFFMAYQEREKYRVPFSQKLRDSSIEISSKLYWPNTDFLLDFADIKGQSAAKEACKIAALGMHNLLLEGSPGCGKSMCAKRIPYIMPPMSLDELLESNAYKSLGSFKIDFSPKRPFRSPHRSATQASILGGGNKSSRIGEIALAHNGVLFFDEFAMFDKKLIENLREPLEDNEICISRVNSKVRYKTKFLFIAAQNPCPCGKLFAKSQDCRCSDLEINRYRAHISAPIYDRLDMYLAMDESNDLSQGASSAQMAQEIREAFLFQKSVRGQDEYNGKLEAQDVDKFCILSSDADQVLEKAKASYQLSVRSLYKCKKLARSIADLDKSELIEKAHVLKALSYRFKARS